MPRVQFNQGGAKVGETTQATVEAMAEYMKSNDKTYTLVGYASIEGSTEFNQTLSVQRAEALKNLLVELGVDESRLTVVGNGETDKFSTENLSVNRVVIVE
jgi:OOP family OmpA-OmpF porin